MTKQPKQPKRYIVQYPIRGHITVLVTAHSKKEAAEIVNACQTDERIEPVDTAVDRVGKVNYVREDV